VGLFEHGIFERKPNPTIELRAVADLDKVNGDLGRVAGLLKLWLAEKLGQGASPMDVEAMMNDFRKLQSEVLSMMPRIIR